ncbi:hypothetical protein GCM10028822_17080 [Hymenobacter terrigena]
MSIIDRKKYCEHGHLVLGVTCNECAQRTNPTTEEKPTPAVPTTPNRTLVELRNLKSMLQNGLITEEEYDERRNHVLANF